MRATDVNMYSPEIYNIRLEITVKGKGVFTSYGSRKYFFNLLVPYVFSIIFWQILKSSDKSLDFSFNYLLFINHTNSTHIDT